jgi:hypothetical protein
MKAFLRIQKPSNVVTSQELLPVSHFVPSTLFTFRKPERKLQKHLDRENI